MKASPSRIFWSPLGSATLVFVVEKTFVRLSPAASVLVIVRSSPGGWTPLTKTGNLPQITTPVVHDPPLVTVTPKPSLKKSAMLGVSSPVVPVILRPMPALKLPGLATVPRSTLTGPMLAPMWAAPASTLTPNSILDSVSSTRVFSIGSSMASAVSGSRRRSLTVPLAVTLSSPPALAPPSSESPRSRLTGCETPYLRSQVRSRRSLAPPLSTSPKSMVELLPSEAWAMARASCSVAGVEAVSTLTAPRSSFCTR